MTHSSEPPVAATPTATATVPSPLRRASRFLKRLGPIGPLAVAASVLPGLGALVLYGRLGVLAPWLRDHSVLGPVLCAATFAAAGGLALVPTYALSALCGWSFGFPVGLTATLCGFLTAALVGYSLARAADGGRLLRVVEEMPKWQAVRTALATGGMAKETLVVALVRLAPVAPFSLTNLVMAVLQVRMLPYALGTVFGTAPRTAVLVYAASRLSNVDAPLAEEPWLVAAGALATVAVVLALGWIGKKGLAQVTAAPDGGV